MVSALGCHHCSNVGLRAGKLIIAIDVNRHRSATLALPPTKKTPHWGTSHALRAFLTEVTERGEKHSPSRTPSVDTARALACSELHAGAQQGLEGAKVSDGCRGEARKAPGSRQAKAPRVGQWSDTAAPAAGRPRGDRQVPLGAG